MTRTRIVSLLLSLLVLCGVGWSFGYAFLTSPPESPAQFGEWANRIVRDSLGRIEALEQIAPSVMLLGGAKEQDGIFITENYLLENISPTDEDISRRNAEGIAAYLAESNFSSCVALIPTAVAIKQQELPANAGLFNQKAFISDVYQKLRGQTSTVDIYSTLFSASDEYTYYRTASNLTGLGGYYVYSSIAGRLGLSVRPLEQFEIEHLSQDYYGDLYSRSSYKGVEPDLITLYRFTYNKRAYQLTCTRDSLSSSYYTLFPTQLETLGRPQDVVLGGLGETADIRVISPYDDELLIFGDETAMAYLPFLAVHYGRVTFIDLTQADPEELKKINPEEYDSVLFAYSVKTFLQEELFPAN